MSLLQDFVKRIEKERTVRIPLCFLNNKGAKALDEALESLDPAKARRFYREFHKYYDITPLRNISREISRRGNCLPGDSALITKLAATKRSKSNLIFEMSGSLYYVSTVLDDYERHSAKLKRHSLRMRRSIRVSIFLWTYMNVLELVNKYVAELLLNYLQEEGLTKRKCYKRFLDPFMDSKYPAMGATVRAAIDAGLLRGESIFSNNRIIRNDLAHANMYYDPRQKRIYSSDKEYALQEFSRDLKALNNFLFQLLYELNNNDADLEKRILHMLKAIQKQLLKIERSGPMKKAYREVILSWKSDAS
jgi:hypothetical protein